MTSWAGKVGPCGPGWARSDPGEEQAALHRLSGAEEAQEAGGCGGASPPRPLPWDKGQWMLRRDAANAGGMGRAGGMGVTLALPAPASLSVSICKMRLVAIVRFKLGDAGRHLLRA